MVREHLQEFNMSDNPYASPTTTPTVPVAAGTMRIRRIGVLQAAKLSAVFNLLFTAIVLVPFMMFMMAVSPKSGAAGFGVLGLLILPVIYSIIGFVVGAIAAFLYNLVAGWVGGLEIELQRG